MTREVRRDAARRLPYFVERLPAKCQSPKHPSLVYRQIVCYFSAVKGNFVNIAPGKQNQQ
jgi:hypothetical protein